MLGNRPNSPGLLTLLVILLLMTGVVGPAAAEILIDTEYSDSFSHMATVTCNQVRDKRIPANGIIMSSELSGPEFNSMIAQMPASSLESTEHWNSLPSSGQAKVNWHKSDYTGVTGDFYMSGTYGYFKYTAGGTDYLQLWAEFDDPVGQLTGPTYLKCVLQEGESIVWPNVPIVRGTYKDNGAGAYNKLVTDTPGIKASFGTTNENAVCILASGTNTYPVYSGTWKNGLRVETLAGGFPRAQIDITKEYDGYLGISNHDVKFGQTVYSVVGGISDMQYVIPESEYPFSVSIYNAQNNNWYNSTYGETPPTDPDTDPDPDNTHVTVYVRDSQTYALIADSHIVISASVDNEFYEVINQTLPSGTYTGPLQPTGGGMPNPDFYRLIVTAEGYNSIMPYIDFEFKEASTIYAYLDPIGGAPEDENNTFIDFYVRDMSANPISGATVNFGGYTLITNSAGYTIFEVDKNNTYSWTVSKSGYGSLTGNAVIGDDPRHTINTVLAPAVTPTTPTAIPTSTPISPTPTMTAPTGEPTSNFLEWFAAHFGMLLGGGVEIGKIFMWLCFAVPVGVYVGKEAKAGAAGFMAGAGIVTLFFVLIGWVPIWLLVLIALIIGLLYAKIFNNSDTGGGR